jgi:hypothetical protein
MFSLDRFYYILHDNLISFLPEGKSVWFFPFGTYDNWMYLDTPATLESDPKQHIHCFFFDQEPYYDFNLDILGEPIKRLHQMNRTSILANSEHSEIKQQFLQSYNMKDWYYFYHGFAALDWYRDFQYLHSRVFDQFDKVFICYNHLISNLRSHRLHLVSNLIKNDLTKYGHVSLFLQDETGTWQDTVNSPDTPLDPRACSIIQDTLSKVNEPLIIDTDTPNGSLSANVDINQLTSALWHVVTETVYFLPKLHLTEKVFKPIVAKRPFILVAAPGNLAYLKSYGFKTFGRWIDESYDLEPDHYIRIEKITAEIAKLCAMDRTALEQMHTEMKEILEYNFNHFYTTFKEVIINELVVNFNSVIPYNLPPEYLAEVKTRLAR